MNKLILFITICVAAAIFNACRTDDAESGKCEIMRADSIICESTADSVVSILSPYLSVLSLESGRNITVDEYINELGEEKAKIIEAHNTEYHAKKEENITDKVSESDEKNKKQK